MARKVLEYRLGSSALYRREWDGSLIKLSVSEDIPVYYVGPMWAFLLRRFLIGVGEFLHWDLFWSPLYTWAMRIEDKWLREEGGASFLVAPDSPYDAHRFFEYYQRLLKRR